jgi:hypothetical protein
VRRAGHDLEGPRREAEEAARAIALATAVIGGLVTATLLTLLVLPAIYRWFAGGLPATRPGPEEAELSAPVR